MEEDPLIEHASMCLGDILVASSLTLTKMQKLKEAASQDALLIKELKHRETAIYLEVLDLRKYELATKKLLFEKSQEALGAHAKVLDLWTEVVGLKEEGARLQEKSVKLEEESVQLKKKSSQLEEQLAKLKEKFVAGFEDAIAQVSCVHPGVDLSQTGLAKKVADGQLMDADM